MDSFDSLKLSFQAQLLNSGKTSDEVEEIINIFMESMSDYDVLEKPKSVILYDVIPDSLNKYLSVLKLEGRKDGTIYNYQKILTFMFQYIKKRPEEIEYRDIWEFLVAYQNSRKKPISDITARQYQSYITYYFKWLQNVGYITKNPTESMHKIKYEKKKRKSMTRHDLILLSDSCANPKECAVIEFIYSTGCRISEAVAIKLSDIDWKERTVKVIRKGNKEGMLYFGDRAEIAVKKYLKTRTDNCEYLFVSDRGHHSITTNALGKTIKKIYKRTGVENISVHVSPHVIRHTTATLAIQAGMPVEYVQQMMGHEQINTTMEYIDIAKKNVRDACTKYIV